MLDASPSAFTSPDLMTLVESAAQVPIGSKRESALIEALRTCRKELDNAKRECKSAQTRVAVAKEKFDALATMLAGGDTSTYSTPTSANLIINDGSGVTTTEKRERGASSPNSSRQSGQKILNQSLPNSLDGGLVTFPPTIPTNLIHVPAPFTYYSIAQSDNVTIDTHRDNFYRKLLGIPASEVQNYVPPASQANLRSKSQLAEGIHIARHWDTGDDELDAAAFRSRHKTWYSKMKPMSREVGRRTGIHLRTLDPSQGLQDGETVLCRYNKDGTKSILYIDVTQIFDALFEIHCLELNHVRGNNSLKSRVDDLYANVTDSQVKAFLDTCPICMERRGRPPTMELGMVAAEKSQEV